MDHSPPDEAALAVMFDRLWGDQRRRADRSEFTECAACGRAVRWVTNVKSRLGSSLQVVARPVTTAAFFDPENHRGLVAVHEDGTGFTVGRFTTRDDVGGTFLYQCHWDVCDYSARVRDCLHRERYGAEGPLADPVTAADALHRYASWRRDRG